MAPIDPNQLLQAFAPLLTPNGGIKNATEVPRLSSLMQKFSRKLVSRCVYCNVLLATSPDVLEEFLKSGGWKTIDQWIQSAKELGNKPFLNELCELLLKLPMNVERLREDSIKTPKIIKTLSKSDDPVLAPKAKQIVEKWTKMIEEASVGLKGDNNKEHNHKKRKKKDSVDSKSNNSPNKETIDAKKTKLMPKSQENNVPDLYSTDSNLSFESYSKDESSSKSKPDSKPERLPRPMTAKVKPGKSRLGELVSTQSNSKPIKMRKESPLPLNSNKKLISNPINKTTISSISDNQNSLPITSSPKVKPQVIDTKSTSAAVSATAIAPSTPTTTTALAPMKTPSPPPPPVKQHVLQDSSMFMDSLIADPIPSSSKKRRRLSSQNNLKDATNTGTPIEPGSSPKGSPPKPFSFYKDVIDEKLEQRVDSSDSNQNDDNEDDVFMCDTNSEDPKQSEDLISDDLDEERSHTDIDITVPDISMSPSIRAPIAVISERSSQKIKGILCYVKKGTKKSVSWPEESRLQKIKYFELDETERVNVNRPPSAGGYNDLKRWDMRHEAEFMLSMKGKAPIGVDEPTNARCDSYGIWKLILCDGDTNLIEIGKDSKERVIQLERMRTTLASFYPSRGLLPESPQEPELEVFAGEEGPKVIPLEDDNNPNNIHDYSNIDLPQPKTGEQLPPRIPDLPIVPPIVNNFEFTPRMPFIGSQPMGHPVPTPFNTNQPMIPPFGQNMDPFGGPPHQQFFPPNNGPLPFQQWPDNNNGPPPQHPGPPQQQSFVPRFSHGPRGPMGNRPPRLPRNAQNTVCRHFARTGKCRFQPKCNFLHTNDR